MQNFFRLQKLWNETGELCLIFFSNWLIPFWNPLLIICCAASFDGTDNLPIEFLGHAASNGTPQPSRHNVHIYLRHGATFAARPCRAVLLCAVWHNVGVSLKLSVLKILQNLLKISKIPDHYLLKLLLTFRENFQQNSVRIDCFIIIF